MKRHPRGLNPIIIVVVITIISIGLVGAAWWYQEHEDDAVVVNTNPEEINSNGNNSELSKYENTTWGFSFGYPPFMDSIAQEVNLVNKSNAYFNGKGLLRVYTPGQNPYLDIYIIDDSVSNVKKWIEDFAKNSPPKSVEWSNGKINGIDAEKGTYAYNLDGTYFYNQYVFSRLGKTWVVFTFNSEGEEDAAIQNLKFKTTDSSKIDTSNWQTYEFNGTYSSFSIKHPNSNVDTSGTINNPVFSTSIEKCSLGYNDGGLGRGMEHLQALSSRKVRIDSEERIASRWGDLDTGRLILEVIVLRDNISSMIEIGYPGNKNEDCQQVIDTMLSSFEFIN